MRKVRTASGAVAVQVMRKSGRRDELVKHVGSAHTDAELGILLEQARQIVTGDQDVLDFEVPARIQRVTDVADWRSGTLTLSPGVPKGAAVAPGRTAGTCSRLLYDVIGAIYDWVGFDVVDDPVFRDLVIARIVEPTSKVDALRVLTDLGADTVSYRTIQRSLAKVNAEGYRDAVAAKCFTHAADRGGLSLLLYDVTTLYFEAENEDGLRKVGYSKERRIDPQIVVGLLVDRTGFPLEIGCFEGNTAETTTIIPIITAFAQRHLEAALPTVDPAEAYSVTHKALGSAIKVIARADDSSGIIGDACRRLLELHPKIAAAANVAAAKLIDWMITFQFDGDVDYFTLDPVAYAPALSEAGMIAYRARLMQIEASLGPRPGQADRWTSPHSHEWFTLEWNARRLAVLDRDIDAIIATHARDRRVAAWLQDTAQAFEEIGRPDLAIEWAKRATDFNDGHQSRRAADYWCELLDQHRPHESLQARLLVFRRWPSATTAAHLHAAARHRLARLSSRSLGHTHVPSPGCRDVHPAHR